MIQAILIDDELISLNGLSKKIKTHCPNVNLLKTFNKPAEAIDELDHLKPDVVFLDIEMPKMNGFNFLEKCKPVSFEVIFVTAYDAYAIDALRVSALDFLLKPVDPAELIAAVQRLEKKLNEKNFYHGLLEQQLQIHEHYRQSSGQFNKIALPVSTGLEFVNQEDILRIEGENMYSTFYLKNGNKIMISRTLKDVERMVGQWHFVRVHKSSIINLNHVNKYIKGERGRIILSDGSEVEVSRRNKSELMGRINP